MNIHYRRHPGFARAVECDEITAIRSSKRLSVDFNNTAFVYYPHPRRVRNQPQYYEQVRNFARLNKLGQRRVLSRFFDVPTIYPDGEFPYVVRPTRHFGGTEFNVVNNEEELNEQMQRLGSAYASELFRRDREFRHLFVGGELISVVMKSRPEGVTQEEPWNYNTTGGTFMTVTRDINDKLLSTNFYEKVSEFLTYYPLDVVAFDTAYRFRDNSYRLFEVNLAPSIQIGPTIAECRRQILNLR